MSALSNISAPQCLTLEVEDQESVKPYLLLAPVCNGLMPCQLCPAKKVHLSHCLTAWELPDCCQVLTLVRGAVSFDQDVLTPAICMMQWVWNFCAFQKFVSTSVSTFGTERHCTAAPELDQLLGHVNTFPLGTVKYPLELLQVLQAAAALLHISLNGRQRMLCCRCLHDKGLCVLHMAACWEPLLLLSGSPRQ